MIQRRRRRLPQDLRLLSDLCKGIGKLRSKSIAEFLEFICNASAEPLVAVLEHSIQKCGRSFAGCTLWPGQSTARIFFFWNNVREVQIRFRNPLEVLAS